MKHKGMLETLHASPYSRLWAFIVHCTVPAAADDMQQVQTDAIYVICLAVS